LIKKAAQGAAFFMPEIMQRSRNIKTRKELPAEYEIT